MAAAAGGAVIAAVTMIALAVRHALAGPTLLGAGGALVETLIAIALGAGLGAVVAAWHRRRAPASDQP